MLTENLKKAPFRKGDIIVYLVLAVAVLALFLTAGVSKKSLGFTAELSGNRVMEGDFEDKSVNFDSRYVQKIGEDVYKITSEKGYNVIFIDWQNNDIKVTETDCGTSKECTFMSLKSGDIICAPHSLIIRSLEREPIPIVG